MNHGMKRRRAPRGPAIDVVSISTRLKQLEDENGKLRKVVADLSLDK